MLWCLCVETVRRWTRLRGRGDLFGENRLIRQYGLPAGAEVDIFFQREGGKMAGSAKEWIVRVRPMNYV